MYDLHRAREFSIRENISNFIHDYYGCGIIMQISHTDAINGYGSIYHVHLDLVMVEEKCEKCGWSSLFSSQKELDNSKCRTHRWNKDYRKIFSWSTEFCKSLEEAFVMWLELQPVKSLDNPSFVYKRFLDERDYTHYLQDKLDKLLGD